VLFRSVIGASHDEHINQAPVV